MITEKFECTRDGLTIRGNVYRPQGTKLPLMIVSHGFMSTGRIVKREARKFAELGYAAVACDFNGGGTGSKSDGKSTDMSVLTEVEDLLAIIEAASRLDYVDPEDLSLCGCSQGGFVSAIVAARLKERIKRLILFYPALCIPDDARAGKMMFAKFDPQNVPETFRCGLMKLGSRYVTDVRDMDPFEALKGYTGPVLIIHGSADEVVNKSYARRAFRTYLSERGGKPDENCQLIYINKGNHGLRGLFAAGKMDYAFFAIEKFLEGKAQIINVDVRLTTKETEKLSKGKKVKLFFTGKSGSPFFIGEVQPGAFDEQICYGPGAPDSCHAVYEIAGKDYQGKPCTIQITNDMPSGGKKNWSRGWKPTVNTDSAALAFLADQQCETYAEMRRSGPYIHIFAKP